MKRNLLPSSRLLIFAFALFRLVSCASLRDELVRLNDLLYSFSIELGARGRSATRLSAVFVSSPLALFLRLAFAPSLVGPSVIFISPSRSDSSILYDG